MPSEKQHILCTALRLLSSAQMHAISQCSTLLQEDRCADSGDSVLRSKSYADRSPTAMHAGKDKGTPTTPYGNLGAQGGPSSPEQPLSQDECAEVHRLHRDNQHPSWLPAQSQEGTAKMEMRMMGVTLVKNLEAEMTQQLDYDEDELKLAKMGVDQHCFKDSRLWTSRRRDIVNSIQEPLSQGKLHTAIAHFNEAMARIVESGPPRASLHHQLSYACGVMRTSQVFMSCSKRSSEQLFRSPGCLQYTRTIVDSRRHTHKLLPTETAEETVNVALEFRAGIGAMTECLASRIALKEVRFVERICAR